MFKPGHIWRSDTRAFVKWYFPLWMDRVPGGFEQPDFGKLRDAFTKAVERRMMSDVPWGVLLSGGLDSSLVASVAQKLLDQKAATSGDRWMSKLHSFSVGLEGSPDLAAAAKAAKFIGTVHHPYTFTLQEGLDALAEVIYHLETYDVTSIRASTPMFLMSRKIKAMGVKMVLSGEGADEILAGYLYFHKAPNAAELHAELKDKLAALHIYDCLRANKATMAWGLEARVPFLDADFLEVAMAIDPEDKMIKDGRIEKWVLRKAFDVDDEAGKPFLPQEILWRQKEQFSDGVGYGTSLSVAWFCAGMIRTFVSRELLMRDLLL
jgi:asparagine synthase (glutamine-hydrolysing)